MKNKFSSLSVHRTTRRVPQQRTTILCRVLPCARLGLLCMCYQLTTTIITTITITITPPPPTLQTLSIFHQQIGKIGPVGFTYFRRLLPAHAPFHYGAVRRGLFL